MKKQPAQTRTRKKTEVSTKGKIYILGESPLVEEYAELCATKGFDVVIQWNELPVSKKKFDGLSVTQSGTIPKDVSVGVELTNTDRVLKEKNIQKLDKALAPALPLLSSSVTVSAMEQTTWVTHRNRVIGFCALPTFTQKSLVEVAPTVFSPKENIESAQQFFKSLDKETVLVQDRVGMVLPRILCQVFNEAVFALQEDIASPLDIDIAMKLGTNYPLGPIEWADTIGAKQVYAVLCAIERDLKEDRYRIAPLLKQMAQTGEWWRRT